MTDEELRVEFYSKLEKRESDHPMLIIASVAMHFWLEQRSKELNDDPGIGAESFKGVED